MPKKHVLSLLILLFAASLALPGSADSPFDTPPQEEESVPYVPGEMIVRFKSDSASGLSGETREAGPEALSPPSSLQALYAEYGLQSVERLFEAKSAASRDADLQNRLDAR